MDQGHVVKNSNLPSNYIENTHYMPGTVLKASMHGQCDKYSPHSQEAFCVWGNKRGKWIKYEIMLEYRYRSFGEHRFCGDNTVVRKAS